MIPLAAFVLSACVAVGPGDSRILLHDLKPAFPTAAFSAPDTPVAFAPAPGVVRRFTLPELRRLSRQFHLDVDPQQEICVTRPVAAPDPSRFLAVMHDRYPGASIQLLDFSRWPVPEGQIEFPPSGLHQGFWRGDILYGGNMRFAIWAKVNLTVATRRVVALRDLPQRRPIDASALRLDSFQAAPTPDQYPDSIAAVAGKLLRRSVPAGTAIRAGWLEDPPLISRGETVKIEVHSGAAVLKLDGQALADGGSSDIIPVLNPASGKRFRARIEGPGRVRVEALP
ncbi:MAG TPA: flagellar basal body P-ring formation chaperone FlgA [Bryobacteraceae bacterium]|nr:flagellar basal body P-ring formation chaperone FlgA [Bryobacteraceae bacterium]